MSVPFLRSLRRSSCVLAAALLLTACAAPLTVATGGDGDPPPEPAEGDLVRVVTADGATLRGVFVDAGPGSPVVLHLLPRRMSVRDGFEWAFGTRTADATMAHLQVRGMSSLALDYRGVGWSPGSPDPGTLVEDGRAMWREAVRRAGGDEERIVLRAASLGTLVTSELLADGARPGAVVLYAPVRAETVVRNGAAREYGGLLGAVIDLFSTSPFENDLVAVLPAVAAPVLVVLPEEDALLPAEERAALVAAAAAAGARVVDRPEGHEALVVRAYGFATSAETFSGHVMDDLPPEESEFLSDVLSGTR